mgnify:FL=1
MIFILHDFVAYAVYYPCYFRGEVGNFQLANTSSSNTLRSDVLNVQQRGVPSEKVLYQPCSAESWIFNINLFQPSPQLWIVNTD